jgi:bifunctional non-homologous end joining protein LigD
VQRKRLLSKKRIQKQEQKRLAAARQADMAALDNHLDNQRGDHLARYRKKRDFTKTPEPKGHKAKKAGHAYLIQKHDARRLHYDFRLELDGTLKSWAVTRGPSLDPRDKRLAVEVEDHPVAYGSFEGTIPKGQYGGGTVMLWDQGSWEPINDPHEGLKKGKLEFYLHGKRLKGEWVLVRMHAKDEKRNNWLLIKRSDEFADAGDEDHLLSENTTSVVSKRSMEDIAAKSNRIWQSNSQEKEDKDKIKVGNRLPLKKGTKARLPVLPKFFPPQLATLTDIMSAGKDWVHEVKFDGYRVLSFIEEGVVRMLTRTGQNWTHKFHPLEELLARLPLQNAILDGEVVAINEKGISSFKVLQEELSEGRGGKLQYYVFDLLYLDGRDLRDMPLLERKKQLEKFISPKKPFMKRIFYSEHFANGGNRFLQRLCNLNLEGAVSKRKSASYSSGRGTAWLKTKCHLRQEFVTGGFTLPTHKERGIGSLLLGYYKDDQLIYSGKVGTGFDHSSLMQLRKKLDALKQKDMPFLQVPANGRRGAKWVKPELVCEVEFTEWTRDGRLRHPSFQGLREDKSAKTITRDIPLASNKTVKKSKAMKKSKIKVSHNRNSPRNADAKVGGISISHPNRLIYPGSTITKLQLAEYYFNVADYILPHVINRPLSMVRCPEGTGSPCFFQRHIAHGQSPHLYDTGIEVKGRNETYMMIKDIEGLITLVQWGVIELHPWGCRADKPQLPDRIIFDFDPDPELSFKYVIEGAKDIRERMGELGLESFIKTTGGKGLHVVIPLERKYGWATIKAFARAVAQSMEHDDPKCYVATASKAKRKGKVFVDYLRNELTSTAVAPYSARAREGAPVATPLVWEKLKPTLKPKEEFTIETVPQRLAKLKKDPWKDLFSIRQNLQEPYLRSLNIEAK